MITIGSCKKEWRDLNKFIENKRKNESQSNQYESWNKPNNGEESNQNFKQVINRTRMFSPSSWVRNIREFKQQILENRKAESFKVQKSKCIEPQSDKVESHVNVDPMQLEIMLNIHKNLILRTSKLIDKVKKSQYGGFFSPRRLRNRIKLGNFSQLPWSPEVIKRRALSPWNKIISLSEQNSTLHQDGRKIVNHKKINSSEALDLQKQIALRSDSILNRIRNSDKVRRLRLIGEKYQKIEWNEVPTIDNEYSRIQQRIKTNFSF